MRKGRLHPCVSYAPATGTTKQANPEGYTLDLWGLEAGGSSAQKLFSKKVLLHMWNSNYMIQPQRLGDYWASANPTLGKFRCKRSAKDAEANS